MDPEKIQKHLNVFHNLLIDILRRRELFRIFEENLKGKATEDVVKKNWFISFYITDYARAQATDLRKLSLARAAPHRVHRFDPRRFRYCYGRWIGRSLWRCDRWYGPCLGRGPRWQPPERIQCLQRCCGQRYGLYRRGGLANHITKPSTETAMSGSQILATHWHRRV